MTIPPAPFNMVKIQPNPTFQDEAEMSDWVAKNIPGAKIIRTWKVEKLACEVLAPEPKSKKSK